MGPVVGLVVAGWKKEEGRPHIDGVLEGLPEEFDVQVAVGSHFSVLPQNQAQKTIHQSVKRSDPRMEERLEDL